MRGFILHAERASRLKEAARKPHLSRFSVSNIHNSVDLGQPLVKLLDPVGHCAEGHNYQERTHDLLLHGKEACREDGLDPTSKDA